MKRPIVPALLVTLVCAALVLPVAAAERGSTAELGRPNPGDGQAREEDSSRAFPGPGGPAASARVPVGLLSNGIVNRVVKLLDGDVLLTTVEEDGSSTWESSVFDTSQFNRIGLRFSAELEQGEIYCRLGWRFGPDDEFREGLPLSWFVAFSPGERPGGGVFDCPGGIRQCYPSSLPRSFPYYAAPTDFTEVRGLQGIVRCSLGPNVVIIIGDDPETGPVIPDDITGVLTDVKVLLRKE